MSIINRTLEKAGELCACFMRASEASVRHNYAAPWKETAQRQKAATPRTVG